jgi:hypothetical protein
LNKYSHSCEEELIGEALKFVDAAFPNGMLVEFGGSTGKDNSNLFVFGEQGRELVLIESNPTRLKKLAQEITPHSTIKGICRSWFRFVCHWVNRNSSKANWPFERNSKVPRCSLRIGFSCVSRY